MAKFNPDVSGQTPSFDRASEGYRPVPEIGAAPALVASDAAAVREGANSYKEKAKAASVTANGLNSSLYYDFANTLFGAGVKSVDRLVQTHIENSITDQVDQIRDEFGVGNA